MISGIDIEDMKKPIIVGYASFSWSEFEPTKRLIYVYPDYCSSGLWWDGASGQEVDPEELQGIVPEGLLIALKYWHEIWEYVISNVDTSPSDSYLHRWNNDGNTLVLLMNAAQCKYNFVYVEAEL